MYRRIMLALALTLACSLLATMRAQAQCSNQTIYSFGTNDGHHPKAGMIEFSGNAIIYGVTKYGGVDQHGTLIDNGVIFSFNDTTNTYTTLYTFSALDSSGHNSDGANPTGTPSVWSTTDTLYGTCTKGGLYGCGTVWELKNFTTTPTFTTLYNFTGGSDGSTPIGGVVPYVSGSTYLFGTCSGGGDSVHGWGTIYQVTIDSMGGTSGGAIYTFNDGTGHQDGSDPEESLYMDTSGNWLTFYGTCKNGGAYSGGTFFKFIDSSPSTSYTKLHDFGSVAHDGINPMCAPKNLGGTFWGTCAYGRANGAPPGYGTLWSYNPSNSQYTIAHHFGNTASDGTNPLCGVSFYSEANGILRGTCAFGGSLNYGTFYAYAPTSGTYNFWSFGTGSLTGKNPESAPTDGSTIGGCIYMVGNTYYGGSGTLNNGTIYHYLVGTNGGGGG